MDSHYEGVLYRRTEVIRAWVGFIAVLLGFLGLMGYGTNASAQGPDRPMRVVVSLPPLAGLVKGLTPEGTRIDVLIPPGVNEHGYEIPPSRLAAISTADVLVYVGLGLEPQVEKLVRERPSPTRRTISFAEVVGEREDDAHHDHDHEHGEHCAHGVDPHLWLDPMLVRTLVRTLATELRAVDPRAATQAQVDALIQTIEEIDRGYETLRLGAGSRVAVVAHDAYGRLAARYGFETIAIAGLNASEPTPSAIAAAVEAIKSRGVNVVFVEPQLSKATARRIARACSVDVRTLDPVGGSDWAATMRQNLEELRRAFGVK
ncbi:MAG: zinc ABC transporter substrate-binding protein [Phycisphaeraceae bacterium]|nr:zinc ABC transporter substrate-binding protein [Phycisphaeraceae bacterium]